VCPPFVFLRIKVVRSRFVFLLFFLFKIDWALVLLFVFAHGVVGSVSYSFRSLPLYMVICKISSASCEIGSIFAGIVSHMSQLARDAILDTLIHMGL